MKVYNVEGHILDVEIVSDTVTADDIMKIEDVMKKMLKDYDKIAIRVVLGRHLDMTIKAQMETLKSGIKMHSQIDRLAVIGDRKMLKVLTSLDNIFVSWKEKYFSIDELEQADHWLKASV